ncbi:hypothetical protein GGR77_000135 [Xanthomonas translucens]
MNEDAVALIGLLVIAVLVIGVGARFVEDLLKEWRAREARLPPSVRYAPWHVRFRIYLRRRVRRSVTRH